MEKTWKLEPCHGKVMIRRGRHGMAGWLFSRADTRCPGSKGNPLLTPRQTECGKGKQKS